jgi:DNA-binding FadR family transcriptional regulator
LIIIIMAVDDALETPLPVRASRAELVARELEREIVDNKEAGEWIGTKHDLRRRFRVGIATVSEALRLLDARGLVEARPGPGGGVFVAPPSNRLTSAHAVLGFQSESRSYEDSLEVRDALEPVIAVYAARHHSPADIKALRKLVAQMDAAKDDPPAFFTYNWQLHRRIAKLCPNDQLRRIYLMVVDYLEASIDSAQFEIFDGLGMVTVHRNLVDAIAKGEGPHLDKAVRAHGPNRIRVQAAKPRKAKTA